ncbi:MAG: hypothetical protein P8075_19405 [Deltaproteobacteria bacterium]
MERKCLSEHQAGPAMRDWGLRAKYNKIRYLPYMPNPALAGFNHARCGVTSPGLSRLSHELLSRDQGDGRTTWQPQGIGSETYLNGTSQGPTPEDARKDGHIRGRSR